MNSSVSNVQNPLRNSMFLLLFFFLTTTRATIAFEKDTKEARRLQIRADSVGSHKAIVLLLDFNNGRSKPSRDDIEQFFNGPDKDSEIAPTGSVQTYFFENSYGLYDVEFFVHEWTLADGTEQSCAGTSGQQGTWPGFDNCFFPALDELEARHKDFSDPFEWWEFDQNQDAYIDNLIILHNGYNGEYGGNDPDDTPPSQRIRSHAALAPFPSWKSPWSGLSLGYYAVSSVYRELNGENILRFNVIMHEFIHTFKMIDLYDTSFTGNGCGGYDLMAYPVGQANDATNPANVGPYTKIYLGWLNPTEISNDGRYDIEASFTSTQVYKVSAGLPDGEYFLIENKNAVGWDVNIWGGGGIVIWHVDETYDAITATEARVAIVQADGNDDLENKVNLGDEGDIWKLGGSKSELSDIGYPNTKSRTGVTSGIRIYDFSENGNIMSFSIEGVGPALAPAPVPTLAPVAETTTPPVEAPVTAIEVPSTAPSVSIAPSLLPSLSLVPTGSSSPSLVLTTSAAPSLSAAPSTSSSPSAVPSISAAPTVSALPTLEVTSAPVPAPTRAPVIPTPGPQEILVPATESPTSENDASKKETNALIIAIPSAVGALLLAGLVLILYKKRSQSDNVTKSAGDVESGFQDEPVVFTNDISGDGESEDEGDLESEED